MNFDIKRFERREGTIIEIAGRYFQMFIQGDLSGDFACWAALDGSWLLYATPYFDEYNGVPITLFTFDGNVVDSEDYECILDYSNTFEEYCGVIKAGAGRLIREFEQRNGITPKEQRDFTLDIAVAKFAGCLVGNTKKESETYYGLSVFSYHERNGDQKTVAIGGKDEVKEAMIQFVKNNMHTFNPMFIAKHTKIGSTRAMVEAVKLLIREESKGRLKGCLYELITDVNVFIESIRLERHGSFGEYLSDNLDEKTVEVDGMTYYVYSTSD